MAEVMDVINAFAMPLKVAWVVWLAWGIGQYVWYRHERSGAPAPRPAMATTKPAVRKPAVTAKRPARGAEAPVLGRLITPQYIATVAKPAPAAAAMHIEPMTPSAPAFDPSTAVIQTFAEVPEHDLDKLVAEFEMQDTRPHQRRHPVGASTFGAQAPQTP